MELSADEELVGVEHGQHEDEPLSLWFWIVPALLLFVFVAFFAARHRTGPRHTSAISSVSTLPELGMVQFDAGRSTLTVDGQATLDRAADAMRGNPNVRLRLEGYEVPGAKTRKMDHRIDPLTAQRAVAVESYLDARGIDRSRLAGGRSTHAIGSPESTTARTVDSRRAELYAQ